MSTTAEFTVAAGDFPLGSSFRDLEGVTVELEKVVPTSQAIVPYLWIQGVGADQVDAALEAHRATQDVTLVETIEGRHLLRVDWNPAYEGFLTVMTEANVVLLSASGTETTWSFSIRGEDRESISDFQTRCEDAAIPIEFTALADLSSGATVDEYGLTDTQRSALELAYERGYFDFPRETSLEVLGAELGISRQAFASRLRRGHRRLIENTLARS